MFARFNKMGKVYLITGDGAGKTTGALGLALRSLGHGHKVVIIQFMKFWKDTGEYKFQKRINSYKVYQFGHPGWLRLSRSEAKFGSQRFKVHTAEDIDRQFALKGLQKAEEVLKKEKPNLLVLDEICLAVHSGLLRIDEVLRVLKKIPTKTNVVLTGRKAPRELKKRADFVNIIVATKFPQNISAQKGIQY